MKFGVIGSAHGHIYEFIEDMLSLGGEFSGVYNDNSELAQDLSKKYSVPLFEDAEKLFQCGIEIAGTTAINNRKIDIIEQCSCHGVHVMADKPAVINEDQYLRLKKVMEEGKIEVGLMLTIRFMDEVQAIKSILDQKTIGELLSVEIFNPHRLTPHTRPDWHFEEDLNGGIVIDLLVHSIDLFNWFTSSEIESYTGVAQKSILKEKKTFYDSSQFFVTSKAGASGYFRVDWHIPDTHWNWGDMRIFCTGSKGCLEARCLGDPLTKEPLVVLFQNGSETVKLNVPKCNTSVTKDFFYRIQKQKHIIGHKDILEVCKSSIEFNKSAQKVVMLDDE